MAPPTLDTDQLRTLVAIAESGSFTRAAGEVNKTQAAVSMQMRRLEEAVGRRLFIRSGRLNRLTPEGEHLLEYARRIIALNNEALTILTEPELSGFVRIGTPDDYAERFLPQIFARFARTHPLVEVEISCQASSTLVEDIQEGNLDLAIVTYMDAKSRGEIIRREQLIWVGSPRHRIEDMEVLPLGLGAVGCSWRSAATRALDAIGRHYRVLYTSPSAAALSAAVMSGLAVTVLPESAVRPGMRRLGEEEGLPSLPDCDIALLRAQREPSPSVDALAAHVVESLANLEPAVAMSWS
ncbi:MAG: LysR substrate-binding domain-containing protein [Hyphomicrobiales bacterium]